MRGCFKIFLAAIFLPMAGLYAANDGRPTAIPPAASPTAPTDPKEISITEKLGDRLDIQNLQFTDESGASVKLSQYFSAKKPVILLFVYYRCPGICNHLLNGFTNSVSMLEWNPGQEYEIVTVSMNPKEDSTLAAAKKETYVRRFGREISDGWHWLVGSEGQIQKLATQLGFGFKYDEASGEYAHSAGIFILSPDGMISRVLYGVDFPYRDLKLSLLEASDGKIGTIMDRVMMFCYRYDPYGRGYGVYALRMVQAGGALTLALLCGYLVWFWSRERKRTKRTSG